MAREHMKSWQVGDVTVTRIVELWDFQDNIQMTMPDATAAAAPPLDPPGVRRRSHGFLQAPNRTGSVTGKRPNSGVLVLPSTSSPARR